MSQPATLDLPDADAVAAAPPTRKLLCLVLLVAAKDGASEVRFEPVTPGDEFALEFPPGTVGPTQEAWIAPPREQWNGCRLRYRLGVNLYDMVPGPLPTSAVLREVADLARLGFVHRPVQCFLRWLAALHGARPAPREARLRLLCGGKAIEILASLEAPDHGAGDGTVVLHLLSPGEASQEAADLLAHYCECHLAGETTA